MQIGQIITRNFALVEVLIPTTFAAGTPINFPNQTLVDGKNVVGIETYYATTLAKSTGNASVISALGITGLVISLWTPGNKEFIKDMPMYDLIAASNGGIVRMFEPRLIDWQKSKIRIIDATNLTAGQAVVLGVHYEDVVGKKR